MYRNPRAHQRRGITLPSFHDIIKPLVRVRPPYTYLHYTNTPKVGINYKTEHETPWGVYTYPLTPTIMLQLQRNEIPYMQEAKYVFLLNAVSDANVLYTSQDITGQQFYDYVAEAEMVTGHDAVTMNAAIAQAKKGALVPTNLGILWNLTRILSTTDYAKVGTQHPGFWTKLLVEIGIDVMVDDGRSPVIHRNEPIQALFLTPGSYNVIELYDNPDTTKQRVPDLAITLGAAFYVDEQLRQIEVECINFTNTSFRGRKLWGWRLDQVEFENVDMRRMVLRRANFRECSFSGVKADNTDFSGKHTLFDECTFYGGSFTHTNFIGASLLDCEVDTLGWKGTEKGTDFTGAWFNECEIAGGDLSGGIFHGASFVGAQIDDTRLFDFDVQTVKKTKRKLLAKMRHESDFWTEILPGDTFFGLRPKGSTTHVAFRRSSVPDAVRFAGADFRQVRWVVRSGKVRVGGRTIGQRKLPRKQLHAATLNRLAAAGALL